VEADSKQGVQAVLLVEDSPIYYSRILPMLYTEILSQTRYLLLHAMNIRHGLLRIRLRPKILLAESYEEAMSLIYTYRDNLLGVISDVRFPRGGEPDPTAGFELVRQVRDLPVNFPVLLQSEEEEHAEPARALQVPFLNKNSPQLLHDLRNFIVENYGFGSFMFRYPDGRVIAEAGDITTLERLVREVPDESLYYHALNNHFSRWFRARTEFEVADKLRFIDASAGWSVADIRAYILDVLSSYFRKYQSGVVLDFAGLGKKDMENAFTKLGTGSLGGKARGVAFINSMITKALLADKYEGVTVKAPRSFVICSDIFEQFIEDNSLYGVNADYFGEEEIARKFLTGALPPMIQENLRILTQFIKCPLAVRSSSILEDSRVLPFAGIYKTYVVPNSHEDRRSGADSWPTRSSGLRLGVLRRAVQYARNADIRIEEEKMAVLIQELVGETYGEHYFPAISGVAQSYNFYPYEPMKPEEGTVSLALGLGKSIVEGEKVYRYSPAHPRMNPLVSSPAEYLQKSQNAFYAINLRTTADIQLQADDSYGYERLPISRAEAEGALEFVASTYSLEDECLYDGINRRGPKVLTFAPILKYDRLPLTSIVKDFLQLGKMAFNANVEIEFAMNIPQDKTKPKEFYFLQIRPMVVGREALQVKIEDANSAWCFSRRTIVNGLFHDIHDIIVVDPAAFQISASVQIAREIGELNNRLIQEKRRCILIGFGRIGTSDQWLGIPLSWAQMSQAHIIVEVDRQDLRPEPSLGSHFFHNLTATNMGYFHVPYAQENEGRLDWDWLLSQPVLAQTKHVKLIRRDEPFETKIDGRNFMGIISRSYR
jgi:hypothetical protein